MGCGKVKRSGDRSPSATSTVFVTVISKATRNWRLVQKIAYITLFSQTACGLDDGRHGLV